MPKAYLEPNAVNWARRDGLTGSELRSALAAHDLEPYVGIHGVYELSRAFLRDQSRSEGVRNFEIVVELDPTFCPPVSALLDQEIDKLRTGASVLPVLDTLNHASAKHEVWRLSKGIFDSRAESFVRAREAEIEAGHPSQMEAYRQRVRRELEIRSTDARKLRAFEDVLQEFAQRIPEIVSEICGGRLTSDECRRLGESLDEYPAIRTTLRANLYLSAITILNNVRPADDKLDDYRHVIEASYSDVFVTGDTQLANTVPRLHRDLRVLPWRELCRG